MAAKLSGCVDHAYCLLLLYLCFCQHTAIYTATLYSIPLQLSQDPLSLQVRIQQEKHRKASLFAVCSARCWPCGPPLRYVKSPPVGTTSGALAFQPVESESWHGKSHLQFPARSYKGQAQLWTSTAVLKVPFLHGENPKKGTRLLWWPAEKEPRYHWDCLGHTGGKQRVRKSQC